MIMLDVCMLFDVCFLYDRLCIFCVILYDCSGLCCGEGEDEGRGGKGAYTCPALGACVQVRVIRGEESS
jgi:hypothetical protein